MPDANALNLQAPAYDATSEDPVDATLEPFTANDQWLFDVSPCKDDTNTGSAAPPSEPGAGATGRERT